MAEQYVPNLGKTPEADARRDAVHVAVAPVVARHVLEPGERVGFYPGTQEAVAPSQWLGSSKVEVVGVVDPFRGETVHAGQRFWLFLYPGTVTSLRHVWSHPAFKPTLPPAGKGVG